MTSSIGQEMAGAADLLERTAHSLQSSHDLPVCPHG